MKNGALQDPRPVLVRLHNSEEIGLMIADDVVEVGSNGLGIDLTEPVELDDQLFFVAGLSTRVVIDPTGTGRAEVTVRLRVEPRT